MPDLTQDGRLISLSVDGQDKDTLLLQSFNGSESISRPYLFQLDVLTTNKNLDFTKVLGQKACITLKTFDPSTSRYFSGYVSRFVQTDSIDGLDHYRMDVAPWIWFLSLNSDCRIFHNLTIPDIIKKIFDTS